MGRAIPALVAEAIGTFGLCFVGIVAIGTFTGQPGGLVGVALAHGLILAIGITVFAAVSGGHLNPAVTVGLLAGGKIRAPLAVGYIVAQVAGGLLAGLAVMAIFGWDAGGALVAAGTPALGTDPQTHQTYVSVMGGCVAEAITTFFLVLAVWGTAVDPRAPKIGGFAIGLTVTADILAIGPLTGAAMNPARATGPALAALLAGQSYDWGNHWIYWVGPIAGGIVASLIYRGLMWPKETAKV